jgi:hypothetical protein
MYIYLSEESSKLSSVSFEALSFRQLWPLDRTSRCRYGDLSLDLLYIVVDVGELSFYVIL